ncbi:MAG: magnesium transporter CorA family protein [Candidatus Moraniibacteriota bacterium]|nr:MAG: magnesium transporter CorA family protein [Candidatus Moranbacteria bacterium]
MFQEIHTKNVNWIHFNKPNEKDIEYLQENFNINPLAVEDFLLPTIRAKSILYENCFFLTILLPLYDTKIKTTYSGELNFIITKDHLVTGVGQGGEIQQLDDFFSLLERNIGKRRLYMSESPAHLLCALLETLLESCFPRLDNITKKIDTIEHHVFQGNEKAMVKEISYVKRDILNFRRTLMPQRSVLESLASQKTHLIPEILSSRLRELSDTSLRLWNALENDKETVESLEKTNESLLSFKLNEKMRIITLFSTILLPMTFYANILGMNVSKIPFDTKPSAFFLHLIIMALISIFTYLFFRWRKWV